jgi:hypothetical protein
MEEMTSLLGLSTLPIEIAENTKFSLHLVIRIEIDLRDNNNTVGVVEIRGGANDTLRAALYYVGADEALYVDLSGMGGGRYKIDSYEKSTTETKMVVSATGGYVRTGDGYYKIYDEEVYGSDVIRYKKVETTTKTVESINLSKIIKEGLNSVLGRIPSISALITGYDEYVPATGTGEVGNELLAEVFAAMQSGDIITSHYMVADGAATIGTEVEVMSLIKQILSCISIDKTGSIGFDSIMIDLTDEVISSIFYMISPGLNLPIFDLSIYIDSEDAFGIKGITIHAGLGGTKTDPLISLSVPIELEWGVHLDDWSLPEFYSTTAPYVTIPITGGTDGFVISLALDGYFRLGAEESTWDMSPLGEVLYNLMLQLQVGENVDAYYGFNAMVNLDITKISGDILSAIGAKIEIIKDPDSNSEAVITIYMENGVLYLDAVGAGIPLVKVNLSDLTQEGFDFGGLLFSQNPYSAK